MGRADAPDRPSDRASMALVLTLSLATVPATATIDLGPEGGSSGGQLLFAGTPHDFLDASGSHTAAFLGRDFAHAPAPA